MTPSLITGIIYAEELRKFDPYLCCEGQPRKNMKYCLPCYSGRWVLVWEKVIAVSQKHGNVCTVLGKKSIYARRGYGSSILALELFARVREFSNFS